MLVCDQESVDINNTGSAEATYGLHQTQFASDDFGPLGMNVNASPSQVKQIMSPLLAHSVFLSLSDPADDCSAHADCVMRHDGCTSLAAVQKRIDAVFDKGDTSILLPTGIRVTFSTK